jgi:hypothetical protein
MNCDDLRHRLPDLAWDALEPGERGPITAHLRDCPGCRRELEELRQVRGLLDAAPTPPVQVDVAAVYRSAAADAARRSRRWRRVALAACVAAAALLLVLVGRLEFRLEAHQFVVRWKAPPPPETPAPSPQIVAVTPLAAPTGPSPEEWRVVNALLQALVDDGKLRDLQHQQDIAKLRDRIDQLQRQMTTRWASAQEAIHTLYIAQFPTRKGDNP